MPVTRGSVKADVQVNLTDLNINFMTDTDLNDAIQDAYDDIAIMTQCIQKNVTLNWLSNLSYYDFGLRYALSDYLGTIAIFNNVSNLWLRDDLSLKDFDRIRRDWENWIGTPIFWAPSDPKNVAICPKFLASGITYGAFAGSAFDSGSFFVDNSATLSLGSFILYYWGLAPTLLNDTDQLLIASDQQTTVTQYATADLLEQIQEFNKAQSYWSPYYENIAEYADRVKRNNKADLLLRV